MLDAPLDMLLGQIQQILDVNGAKGRRQFIRLECAKNKKITAMMNAGSKIFSLTVNNISTSGIAVTGPAEMAAFFPKNSISKSISLTLDRHTFVLIGAVFDCRISGNLCTVVMLLKNYKLEEKALIREFIFNALDEKIKTDMDSCIKDLTDYETLELPEEFAPFGTLTDRAESSSAGSFRKQIEEELMGVEELESI